MRKYLIGALALLTVLLSGCGYNQIQSQDEQVISSWSEV
ncbi:MAG: LemA family protein, partial [Polynucleobacter sp.]|nr:LemA family protein [Polynucleobacter sp.]